MEAVLLFFTAKCQYWPGSALPCKDRIAIKLSHASDACDGVMAYVVFRRPHAALIIRGQVDQGLGTQHCHHL